jgi:pyridoxal phosphate enzyme (YggS family)
MSSQANVAANVAQVQDRIAAACRRPRRDPCDVRIVAVSKTQPADAVTEAIAAGVDAVGENRVQEAAGKRPLVAATAPWHLVGPLQRNKAKQALGLFDLVETVDRVELADRLQALLGGGPRLLPVFIEVNIAQEPQKNGVLPGSTFALVAHLLASCPHLRLQGLMTVPPYDPDPERSRPYFVALRRLAAEVARLASVPPLELSMGMSEDFEVAVEEGATWVRLGRVLFGERRDAT